MTSLLLLLDVILKLIAIFARLTPIERTILSSNLSQYQKDIGDAVDKASKEKNPKYIIDVINRRL